MFASQKKIFVKYLLLVIFFQSLLILPLSANPISDTSMISISILDYDIGWCGGTINRSGGLIHWDVFASIFSFTLGVANFDTTSHALEQVTVAKTGYHVSNGSQFKINESISGDGQLPVTLLPRRYWSWNFSCESCTYKIALQLIVDSTVIDFGVLTTEGFQAKWLTSWTNVIYHTITTATPFPTISFLVPIIGVIAVRRGKTKSRNRRFSQSCRCFPNR